jgi:hypothetical protein
MRKVIASNRLGIEAGRSPIASHVEECTQELTNTILKQVLLEKS